MPPIFCKILSLLLVVAAVPTASAQIQSQRIGMVAQRIGMVPQRCCAGRPVGPNSNRRLLRPPAILRNRCQSACLERCCTSPYAVVDTWNTMNPSTGAASSDAKSSAYPSHKSRLLFDGKSLDDWNKTKFGGEGEIKVDQGQIVFDMGQGLTGINFTNQDFPSDNFELSLQAIRLQGIDMICGVTFPVRNEFCSLIVGGWGGATVGLSSIDGKDASANSTSSILKLEDNRWYKIRIRVAAGRIICYLDDKKVVDHPIQGHKFSLRGDCELSQPIGIFNFGTRSAVKDVRLQLLQSKQAMELKR